MTEADRPTTLLAEQMAERRERILAEAREIIGVQGFDALTMRALAQAAGVTVPTIYNLIGNKDQVLFGAVEEQTDRFLDGLERSAGDVLAVVDATARELLRMPSYYRSLLWLLMSSETAAPARQNVELALRGQLRSTLGELAEQGVIEDWVELDVLRRQIQSSLWSNALDWANGRVTDASLASVVRYGVALLMTAVSRGDARERFRRVAEECQPGKAGQGKVAVLGARR
jgi:AcrR family transcriptional regulator